MYAKHLIWGKKTKFPETCLLSVYKLAKHQNAKKKKKTWKTLVKKNIGKQNNIKKSVFTVFSY